MTIDHEPSRQVAREYITSYAFVCSMLRVQQKISDGLRVLQYFTLRNWDFTNDRLLALRESLSDVDRKEFNMDFEKMDMDVYFRDCILGARQYCLKEDPATIPKARKTLKV